MASKAIFRIIIAILIFVALAMGQVSDRPILEEKDVETTVTIKMVDSEQLQLIIDRLTARIAELEKDVATLKSQVVKLQNDKMIEQ